MQETYRYLGMDTPDALVYALWIGAILVSPLIWKTWQREANRAYLRRVLVGALCVTVVGLLCPIPVSLWTALNLVVVAALYATRFGRSTVSRLALVFVALGLGALYINRFPDKRIAWVLYSTEVLCVDSGGKAILIPAKESKVSRNESRSFMSFARTSTYTFVDRRFQQWVSLDSTQLFWGPNGLTTGDRIAERFLAQSGAKKLASR